MVPRSWLHVTTVIAAAALVWTVPLRAGTRTGSVNVSVTIAAAAKLILGGSTVSFPNADPDIVPRVPASEGTLTVTAKARTGSASPVTLTVLAADDLVSGPNTIAVANVSWTATGSGFLDGSLSRAAAQTVGSWIGPGERSGTQTYVLQNSWAYATGTYTVTATYTLTAP